jgi:hypothetical protein
LTKDDDGALVSPARQAIFRMSAEIAAQIAAHARRGYPHGVCGLATGY